MLKNLHPILKNIKLEANFDAGLQLVVADVAKAVEAEVCGLFIVDQKASSQVLRATFGLKSKLINRLRFNLGEGLIGVVGEKEEALNIANVTDDPEFKNIPELALKKHPVFLGLPLLNQRELVGVLVVCRSLNKNISRTFNQAEQAFLVTLSMQLAAVINDYQTTVEFVDTKRKKTEIKDFTANGVPGAPGIIMGTAMVTYPPADLSGVPNKKAEDIKAELQLFSTAVANAKQDINILIENIADDLSESEKSLFSVYLNLLESGTIIDGVNDSIRQGNWAQGALKYVIEAQIARFESMKDEYLRERGSDIKDLGVRLLAHLQQNEKVEKVFPDRMVLVSKEVSPTALMSVPREKLVGVVSALGSGNSHVAILAKALGVPTVMGVKGMPLQQCDGKEVMVDGYYGQVCFAPSAPAREEFLKLIDQEIELSKNLEGLRNLPAETTDGYAVSLYVNAGLVGEVGYSLSVAAEGVGLFRTEVPFLARDRFPSIDEQVIIYRQLLTTFAPRPVIMRTLDIGGDKQLPYFPIEEANPFLGWRGIRITLDQPDLFLVQLKAMLLASEGLTNLHLMFPMISSISEIESAIRLLQQAYDELLETGKDIKYPVIGVMLEVPSSIYQIRDIAKRVDFLSVGTNDLTQYLLAVDRNNAKVSSLYDYLHPAVLKALMFAVEGAHAEGKHISICGEMAADPVAVILLLAMGFDTLSMNSVSLPRIKWVIRNFSLTMAKELLSKVLMMDDANEIRATMELAIEEIGLGSLIRAGE